MKRKIMSSILACIVQLLFSAYVLASPVPDTGQTTCYDDAGNGITCPPQGQPFYGQDANYTINPMSYTKLDGSGNALPDSATEWVMVRDNVTGLIWEVKTNEDGVQNYNDPHDADNTYTWNDSNPSTNGGYSGTPGNGTDTESFINALNREKFGGYSDWRLPTDKELTSIVNYSIPYPGPAIDTAYFPNTVNSWYWSQTTLAEYTDNAWLVHFDYSYVHAYYKSNSIYARAVRGGTSSNSAYVDNGDGTVTDLTTGLMWQKTATSNKTWEQALTYCENLDLGGYKDWRLPSVKELRSLVDPSRSNPAICTAYFPDTEASWFWTRTSNAYTPYDAWIVNFYFGDVDGHKKDNNYPVRAVRGGQKQIANIGTNPGLIQASIPANETVNLMINSTNSRGDTPKYQWFLLSAIVGGTQLPIYVLSDTGLFDLNQVVSNLPAYTFSFNNSGVTDIGNICMSDLGLKTGDTFVYGYAYKNNAEVTYLDNIITIKVQGAD